MQTGLSQNGRLCREERRRNNQPAALQESTMLPNLAGLPGPKGQQEAFPLFENAREERRNAWRLPIFVSARRFRSVTGSFWQGNTSFSFSVLKTPPSKRSTGKLTPTKQNSASTSAARKSC